MDYPSIAESQQHHHQYQQQQQQQQQSDPQQPYDPAQAQAYAAYYAAYDQYYAASGYYHQPYYPHEYAASGPPAASGGYYAEPPPESAPPAGDPAQIQHSGGHAAAYAPAMEQDGYAYQAPSGLNPAAMAALTQLSQLTGTIDAAERAMAMHDRPPPAHYPHYSQMQYAASSNRPGIGGITHRGGGRRGGGPFRGRGGNRGGSPMGGQHPYRRDGGGPPSSRGRGHGRLSRGRGRRPQHSASDSQHRSFATPNTAETSAAARQQRSLLPVAWCDMCRVDCNSLEILEQHKSGKRHKRTVQRVQEIQAQQKVISADVSIQGEESHRFANDGGVLAYATNSVIPSSGHMQTFDGTIEGSVISENIPTQFAATEQNIGSGNEFQNLEEQPQLMSDIGKSEGPLTEALPDETATMEGLNKKRRMPGYDRTDRWRGSRPKMMRIGRGGRYIKSFERPQSRPFDRPKGPRERPRVCTVCGITCDTMAVFECHLIGKKHLARIKRFEGQNAVFGPITVLIPPNQQTSIQNKGPEPFYYGFQSHEALQQETLQQEAQLQYHGMVEQEVHGIDSQQTESYAAEQFNQPEHSEEVEDAVPDSVPMESSEHPEELHPATVEEESAMPDPELQPSLDNPAADEANNMSAPDETDSTNTTVLPVVDDESLPDNANSLETEIVDAGLDSTAKEPNDGVQ